jgi:hypothetical protein
LRRKRTYFPKCKVIINIFIRELERQLVDNILASTGITAKPSDFQFKDYLTRVKNLNKDTITSLLHERLVQCDETQDVKPLQVS